MKPPTTLIAAAVILALAASCHACPTNSHGTSQQRTTFRILPFGRTPRQVLTRDFTSLDRASDGSLQRGIAVRDVMQRSMFVSAERWACINDIAPGANPIVGLGLHDPWQITLDTSIPFDLSQLTLVSDQGDTIPLTGVIFVSHNSEYLVVRTSIRDLKIGSRVHDISLEWCWAEVPENFHPAALRFTPTARQLP